MHAPISGTMWVPITLWIRWVRTGPGLGMSILARVHIKAVLRPFHINALIVRYIYRLRYNRS